MRRDCPSDRALSAPSGRTSAGAISSKVAAGDYQVIALDYVEDGAWNDPEFLESLRAAATRAGLREASPLEISLTVVTPESGR